MCTALLSSSFFFLRCPLRSRPSPSDDHRRTLFIDSINCCMRPHAQFLPGASVSRTCLCLRFSLCSGMTHLHAHPLSPSSHQAPSFSPFQVLVSWLPKAHSSRCGYRDKRPRCNFCLWYGHTAARCHTKEGQQHKTTNIPQVNPPKPLDKVSISIDAYNEFLQYKAALKPTQPIAIVGQSGNLVACISKFSSLGP